MNRWVLRSRGYQIIVAGSGTAIVGGVLLGVTDPAQPPEPGWSPEAIALLVLGTAVAVRGVGLGLVVTPDHLVLRNVFRTRVLPRVEVVDVRVVNYDGMIVWASPSGLSWFQIIDIRTRGGASYKTYGVVGTARGTRRRVEALRLAIALGPSPEPRHRAPTTDRSP